MGNLPFSLLKTGVCRLTLCYREVRALRSHQYQKNPNSESLICCHSAKTTHVRLINWLIFYFFCR